MTNWYYSQDMFVTITASGPRKWVIRCRVPDDHIDPKRYPLFVARETLLVLIDQVNAHKAEKQTHVDRPSQASPHNTQDTG